MKLTKFTNSVKTKLISLMLLIAIIPLTVAVVVSYSSSTASAKETAKETIEWQAKFIESEVDKMLNNSLTALTSFASSPLTISFLKGELTDASAVKQQMVAINEAFEDNNTIVMSDTTGMMVLRSDDGALKSIAERDYFQNAIKGTPFVSNVFVSSVTNSRNICIAVPVVDTESKKVLGVVHKTFNPNDIHELLSAEADEAFLVDKNADMVAHSDFEISATDEAQNFSSSPYMSSNDETGFYISTAKGYPVYLCYAKNALSGFTVCAAISEADVVAAAAKGANRIIIIGVIMVIIVLVLSLFIASSYTNPMLEVNKLLSSLANGEFKKIDKYTKRSDEFGQMVNNSNSVIDKLQSIVGHIKESSNTVNTSSEELSEMANQIASTTESVAEAVQDIASGASEQAKEVQNSVENAGMITEAIGNVQGSANSLNTLADRMRNASETSSESLSNFHETSEVMTGKIEDIAKKIAATQNAVADINARVEGISGIATQTNLLSLNASIEAARAGDAGKGFAVVAEEIRKLADDSEKLAKEIHEVMETLLDESTSAVKAAHEIIEENKSQQIALADTIDAVNGMIGDIEKTVESVTQISGETDTCVTSNQSVSNAMASLSAISEENAAATETTGASVEELSATVSTLAESATNLKDIAEKLNEEMQFFK
ncbi:methyl-accepting chemotaxis protein [Butyrivibrio sp. INlla14]|uniref:methyl-accepting chemotaxis protein n=1 Tax=Butyrivibrio sp. INlla14 TaxID=1520808 RepID=UPI000876AA36|nr:methyl-accepting chemotaxis protein [Butyrivibrio sp. INlla14]SCY51136.1 methyl-accepting chemotaxis protein [Butyrivibrio sp. INlla14]